MQDPRQPDACFQGRARPTEGDAGADRHTETKLGDLCLAVGNLTDALAYYRSALAKAPADDPDMRLEIVLKISSCLRRQGKSDVALAFVESFMPAWEGRRLCDLLAEKAMLLCLVGRYDDAAGVCEEVQKEKSINDRAKDAGIYLVLGHVLSRLCRWKQAIVCLEQAATFARMCGDLKALGNALNNLGIVYKNLCRFGDASRCLSRAVKVARESRDDASLAVRLLNLATALYKQGLLDAAERAVDESIKISSLLGITRTLSLASICKARLDAIRGDPETAARLLRRIDQDAVKVDEPRVGLLARESLGEVLCRVGRAEEARQVLEACLREAGQAKDIVAEVKSRLAEVYLRLGMIGQARQCAAEGLKIAEEIGDLYEAARCLRVAGMAASEPDQGRAHLARARRILRAIGARLELALTSCAFAERGLTPAAEAARALEAAVAAFETCGAIAYRVRALGLLATVHQDLGNDEKALAALGEAEALAERAGLRAEIVAGARSRIDARLSRRLAISDAGKVTNLDEAFRFFSERLGASGLVVARFSDGGVDAVECRGLDLKAASGIAAAIGLQGTRPLVLTNPGDLLPAVEGRARLGPLLGVTLGKADPRALCVVLWSEGSAAQAMRRPEVSQLLETHYEIRRLAPVLEAALPAEARSGMPLAFAGMLTADPHLARLLLSLPRIAATRANVLVVGETGTGKELVARAIHALSPRRGRPLVVQNCAALPEQLLESELFGHRAGAFTDARADKRGLVEVASGGTFFLDEIGDVSQAIQAKMLRAIESGEIRRLGDTVSRAVDVRFVSATNKDLEHEVEEGRFRRDLFYRLNVVTLALPPLRARPDDVVLLARYFLARFAPATARQTLRFGDGALATLAACTWPGNVRQLENEIERAVAVIGERDVVTADAFSTRLGGRSQSDLVPGLRDHLRQVERSRILAALAASNWNRTHAARLLGDISRPALVAKMKRLGIPPARP